jgi:hypothetical protein
VKARLDRCRKLAREFQEGPTAKHIREIEAALLDDMRTRSQQTRLTCAARGPAQSREPSPGKEPSLAKPV